VRVGEHGVGDGEPGSREAEVEGGEGFYIAQSGRCPDLLVIGGRGAKGQHSGNASSVLPSLEKQIADLTRDPCPPRISFINGSTRPTELSSRQFGLFKC
jgi:hypothetical protein